MALKPYVAALALVLLITGAAAFAAVRAADGSGDEGRAEVAADPDDNAVDAAEQNTVELGGVRYRVTLFRQLNVATAPDDALWEGEPPADGRGLYMVSLRACAAGGEPARTTADVILEDAFGRRFEARPAATSDDYEQRAARPLKGVRRRIVYVANPPAVYAAHVAASAAAG